MKYIDDNGLLYLVQKIKTWLGGKVDKVNGKGLSTNDYSNEEKSKLANLSNYTLPTASANTLGGVKIGAGLQMNGDVLSATGGGAADAVDWTNVTNKPTKLTDFTNDLAYKTAYDASTNKIATESDLAIKTLVGTSDNPIILANLSNGIYRISGKYKQTTSQADSYNANDQIIGVYKNFDDSVAYINLTPTISSDRGGTILEVTTIGKDGTLDYDYFMTADQIDATLTKKYVSINNLVDYFQEVGVFNFAPAYDSSKSYAVGDVFVLEGILCRVTKAISANASSSVVKSSIEQPTVFGVVNSKGYQTASDVETAITSKGYQTASDVEATITNKISSVMTYKGTVANYTDLPTNAKVGDVYNITNKSDNNKAGDNAAWNGTAWDVLSGTIDLSGYYTKSEITAITNDEIDTICADE